MNTVQPVFGKDYEPGSTIFTRKDSGIISKGIIWFQSIDESVAWIPTHVLIVINKTFGIEAAEKGIQFCSLKDYFDDSKCQVVCRKPIDLDLKISWQAINYAYKLKGRPYDYVALGLGYPLMILSGLSRWIKWLRKLPVPFHIPGARVCSAFVADCYKHTDRYKEVMLFKEWHVSRITPVMLWNEFTWKEFKFKEAIK
jgi:hypothetical protein